MFLRASQTVLLAWGWPRRLIALFAGAVGALAMPPLGVWPALIISFTLAVWLLDGSIASGKRFDFGGVRAAAIAGWWFGFGYFLASLWWLGSAFLVEADKFAALMPLGVVGLPAGLAFFMALGFALARAFWPAGPARILVFAAMLTISEWLRGHILTGFPWNSFGLAFGDAALLDQTASLTGLYGLTFLALATLSAPAAMISDDGKTLRSFPLVAASVVLAGMAIYGWRRLPDAPTQTVPNVRLRLMQPNLPQDAKFAPDNRDEIMRRYFELSGRPSSPEITGVASVTHLIWPESSFPFILDRDRKALGEIADFLPPGVTLITGAARADEPLPGERMHRFYNSLQTLDHEGVVRSSYDKAHLVPFGEYLPLRALLDAIGLRQFVTMPGGFTAGAMRRALQAPGLPLIAPLICYEAVFPGEVLPPGPRPGLLLNVTNDAWFGLTPGPYQHFAQARMRAIEEGLPLVRDANTGISAIVDPYGRIVRKLPLGVEGVLDGPLPVPLAATIYARLGDFIPAMMVVFSLLFAWRASRFGRRRSS
ncbi:apolipoprotein N-acyltransferase [Terrarubrum flagellatum]|uniref:apolipoprotein N-acyltransferase n=1 Tax=Terrirubrum flagellatum TaxID=2895980 RepID=UPI0031454708